MTKQEIIEKVNRHLVGQGSQVDVASVLPSILLSILGLGEITDGKVGDLTTLTTEHKSNLVSAINEIANSMAKASQVGDLATLDTDHKSDLVSAINELAGLVETPHFEVSFSKSSEELKAIYEACAENITLAKNIVFFNATDELYYKVNGYAMVSDVLKLHTIMQGESGLADTVVNITSEGIISIG